MSTEKKYTERDLILAKREAYAAGARWARDMACEIDKYQAAEVYPLTVATRPRVVRDCEDKNVSWRVARGRLEWRDDREGAAWWGKAAFAVTPERVELWAALLASPMETVEDDGNA